MKSLFFLVPIFLFTFVPVKLAFAVGADACGTGGWCACPGGVNAGRCIGSYATCEEACGLTQKSSGSAAMPAAPNLGNTMMQGMMQGMMNGMSASARPKTAQEIEAEQAAAELARQQAIARQQEIERKKKEKADRLDKKAFDQMSLLDSPFNQTKAETTDFQPSKTCTNEQVTDNDLVCHVTVCGGAYNGASVCCPKAYPKLNECNCNCYPNDSHFECMRYGSCAQEKHEEKTQ